MSQKKNPKTLGMPLTWEKKNVPEGYLRRGFTKRCPILLVAGRYVSEDLEWEMSNAAELQEWET